VNVLTLRVGLIYGAEREREHAELREAFVLEVSRRQDSSGPRFANNVNANMTLEFT
jgi:transcriptional regulator of aromatic amino acid metabolism